MEARKLLELMKRLTQTAEQCWLEREALRFLLTQSNLTDWEVRFEHAKNNPRLKEAARQHYAPLIEKIEQELLAELKKVASSNRKPD